MIFVTGGLASGKRSYVRGLGYADAQVADGVLEDVPVILNAQDLVRDMQGGKEADVSPVVEQLAGKDVVTCVEMGSGVVPLDPDERAWRDRAGMLACELAERADVVVRMVCGVPTVLKGACPPSGGAGEAGETLWTPPSPFVGEERSARAEGEVAERDVSEVSPAPQNAGETLWTPSSPFVGEERSARAEGEVAERDVSKASPAPQRAGESVSDLPLDGLPLDSVELVIMRHGATKGNEERRYVGAIDAPLTPLGCSQAVAAGIHPEVERVYVTTLIRSQQTAAICFPCAEQVIVDGLQEMDFGVFGGRTADEMVDDAEYRAWVDGYCEGQCPGGESREQVIARVCRALGRLVSHAQKAGEERVIVVAHGGTMMAALDRHSVDHPERDYYEWNVPNCQGYVLKAQVTRGGTFTLDNCRKFEDLDFLNERL